MSDKQRNQKLEMSLVAMMARKFPGMTVQVAFSERWSRMCVTFRWSGFAGLLPEERFQRLIGVIPEKFRRTRLAGFAWVELAPAETVEEFLKLPRSDDIADREEAVYTALRQVDFFNALREALGPTPDAICRNDFSTTTEILSAKRYPPSKITEAKLVFIRHGTYCDCQALKNVESVLEKRYAGAA